MTCTNRIAHFQEQYYCMELVIGGITLKIASYLNMILAYQ